MAHYDQGTEDFDFYDLDDEEEYVEPYVGNDWGVEEEDDYDDYVDIAREADAEAYQSQWD